jgi:DNA replication and repair protein RecF
MRVEHLSLANFRNYATAELPLGEGPQLLIGRNGQGKTNVLEAISYFDSLSSHRTTSDQPLIRAQQQSGVVRMRVRVRDREVTLELEFTQGRPKRSQVNGNAVKPRELTQWFTCVVFAPEDLNIARGEPGNRRAFLDEAIVTRNPAMYGIYRDYERVLKQRNALLKSVRQGASKESVRSTLPLWNEQLAGYGSRIIAERRQLVTDLSPRLARAYQQLVENDHSPRLALEESVIENTWTPSVSRETSSSTTTTDSWKLDSEHLLSTTGSESRSSNPGIERGAPEGGSLESGSEAFEPVGSDPSVSRETLLRDFSSALDRVVDAELDRGVTLVGPHRDDLQLNLNELPVKGYASHGETWSFVLSLRIAFANLLREEAYTGDPVILLDDVFAELDRRRRQRLMDAVGDYEQIIVTAAVPEDIPHSVSWNVAHIDNGVITDHSTQLKTDNWGSVAP